MGLPRTPAGAAWSSGADMQWDPPVVGDLLREALVLAVMLSKWFKKQIWAGFEAAPGTAACGEGKADTRHCRPCENIPDL